MLSQRMDVSQPRTLVYIPTAQYAYDPSNNKSRGEQRRRSRYDAKIKASLLKQSLSVDDALLMELDAPDLSTHSIRSALSRADVLYIDGGNTFYLQRHLLETNFWDIARPVLAGGCLYIGASAGAIVAGRSIRPAFWKGWDDPSVAGADYVWSDSSTLRGAGIAGATVDMVAENCPYSLFMHYDAAEHGELVNSNRASLPPLPGQISAGDSSSPIASDLLLVPDNCACVFGDFRGSPKDAVGTEDALTSPQGSVLYSMISKPALGYYMYRN